MPLIRAIALKDARASGSLLSSCGEGDPFQLGPTVTGERVFAGIHVLTYCSTQTFQGFISAASSSGAAYTTQIDFTALTCRSGEFTSPVVVSTDLDWFQAQWTMTTSADNGAGVLIWMGIDSQ
jgi:hypothetical protein